jgi:KDO2-lipid IV(A) lauroyltransferase
MTLGARILKVTLKHWPRSLMKALGKPLGFLWWDVFGFRKKVVMSNLDRAFPEQTLKEKKRIGRRSVYMLTENLFEFFLIPSIDKKWLSENVVFEGLQHFDQALADGQGALVLSLHLGNGDLMASSLAHLGYKISIITKFFKNELLNKIWFGIRGAQGVQWIPPHGEKTPFMILKALKAGRVVAFILDQHMGRPYGLQTQFFGHKVGTAYGLALFHMKTKRPVIPVYTFEGIDRKMHIKIEEPLLYDPRLENQDRDQTLVELTQTYTDKIEEIVRRYPDQWMWVHRRWKWKGT